MIMTLIIITIIIRGGHTDPSVREEQNWYMPF